MGDVANIPGVSELNDVDKSGESKYIISNTECGELSDVDLVDWLVWLAENASRRCGRDE